MVSTALMAFSICAGAASAFHCTVITWITVLGFIGAASRKAAATISTAQTAKIVLLVILMFSFRQEYQCTVPLLGEMPQQECSLNPQGASPEPAPVPRRRPLHSCPVKSPLFYRS